ncbi:MAG TPA: hypothetical protein VNH65_04265 [Candidatus Acidoferrum sp.]|nr:hypothetical protein [Candidatus Acidoferrum sp.]
MRGLIVLSQIFLLTTALTAAPQFRSTSSVPFELQGDKLGESFATFISQHPKAHCEDSTKTRKNCYQWDDISIFGFTAHPGPGCTPAKHSSPVCVQGLSAQFAEGRLIMLIYAVAGKDKQPAVASLRKEYDAPVIDTPEGTIWLGSGSSTLSVVVGKPVEHEGAETLITFTMQG